MAKLKYKYFCLFCGASLLSACVITPQRVNLEVEHVSHLTQHEPFTDHPTDFGYDSAGLVAHWEYHRIYLDLAEGIVLDSRDKAAANVCYGGLFGPREIFQARAGIVLWQK